MTDLTAHYNFRDDLIRRLEEDLVGPIEGMNEVLDEDPATAYVMGVLYPQQSDGARPIDPEQDFDDSPSHASKDDVPDDGVPLANRLMPSAMGLTFAVDLSMTDEILVDVRTARYRAVDAHGTPIKAERAERRSADDSSQVRWQRLPIQADGLRVALAAPGDLDYEVPGAPELKVKVRVRPPNMARVAAITITLINMSVTQRGDVLDAFCFFQPQLTVRAPGGVSAFTERRETVGSLDDEILVSRLLHRHAPMFAAGHGCAADWNWAAPPVGETGTGAPAKTDEIRSAVAPVRDVLLTDANPAVEAPSMLWLAEADRSAVVLRLRELVSAYQGWIQSTLARERRRLLGTEFEEVADEQIKGCVEACRRMGEGIDLLADKDRGEVWRAFQLANRAMALQRARTVWFGEGKTGTPEPSTPRWRTFQLGFMLLCLRGLAQPKSPDRDVADVLWFPTGGGKTEAYLGLIAFTTFLRRLTAAGSDAPLTGGGVTVLMRYTLRLLTLQQFERAASLICAMETIRRSDPSGLGDEPISIGMWVGRAATPNSLESAHDSLQELAKGKDLLTENPVQLRACPWCGTPMDHRDYKVLLEASTMSVTCRSKDCDFHHGLPVHVVDEAIYAARPTLVIATADKFAQVAWRGDVARLFNRAGAAEGTRPPELVIQDELHLISGPLGSLAGLYETVVDIACDRPKIVASTATIRRADQQGRALFDRTVRQFPPSGLDSRDSWFAVEQPRSAKASRAYVGLLTSTTSQATLLIRAYAALLHHANRVPGEDAIRDGYWTLVGYFNSLRLLSAAELQVHADVNERLAQLARRDAVPVRSVDFLAELTSRKESSKIPQYLKELFVKYPNKNVIDVLLATNMISVGVDVDRLGLMVVTGQPQTTAEYIQATSRVGRRNPGLVVTLLNSARSRDRSHYESFVAYHSALYRQVESTSVTPWAPRARDRALHAALVGLLRMLHPAARPNEAASRIHEFLQEADELAENIVDRVRRTGTGEEEATRLELERFVEGWVALAASNSGLVYEAKKDWSGKARRTDAALLSAYGQDEDLAESAPTMWSLRDVDVECPLYVER